MIGIFDSGIGGLSVFKEIYRLLPGEDYIYYADSRHCPYGEKSREYVIGRSKEITEFLVREGADIIVVACNTATAAAIGMLRKAYSDPSAPGTCETVSRMSDGRRDHIMFIGMEPAVKPAAELTRTGVVGVLATAGTLNGMKYKATREMFAKGIRVVEHVGAGFVELVEKGITEGHEAESTVERSIRPLLDAGADVIVLGCTHYPFLMETIRKAAGPSVSIIDPAPAVARHLADVMKEGGLLPHACINSTEAAEPVNTRPSVKLFSSGDGDILKETFNTLIRKI